MAKLIQTVLIALLVSICSASPARLEKLIPSKSKFLARQEVAEDIPTQTPYPPAGIRPEVPFNLPTEEKVDTPVVDNLSSGKVIAPADYYLPPIFEASKFLVPSEVYGPPAETYGPPEVSPKDKNTQDTKDEETQSDEAQPDEAQPEEAQSDEAQPEEDQPEESHQEDGLLEETQPDEVDIYQKPAEEVDAEPEQDVSDVAQMEIAEETNKELLERITLAKKSSDKKLPKLQKLQLDSAQRLFLIDGKLYSLRA